MRVSIRSGLAGIAVAATALACGVAVSAAPAAPTAPYYPGVTGGSAVSAAVGTATSIGSGFDITDANAVDWSSVTATVTTSVGTLTADAGDSGASVSVSSNTITISGSMADVEKVLNSQGTAFARLTQSALGSATVTVTVNPSPSFTIGGVPTYFFSGNGHYYRLNTSFRNWSEVNSDAQGTTVAGAAGYVGVVRDELEDDFIRETILPNVSGASVEARQVWLGAERGGTALSTLGCPAGAGVLVNAFTWVPGANAPAGDQNVDVSPACSLVQSGWTPWYADEPQNSGLEIRLGYFDIGSVWRWHDSNAAAAQSLQEFGNNTTYAAASTTATITASDPPYNTVRPSISGNVAVGETLTASTGTWNGNPAPAYSYQWQQCTSQVGVSSTFASLTGSPSSFPEYVRLDPSGNVFSGNRDTANISKLTPAGVAVDSAGATVISPFTWASAPPGSAPFGLALDADGNVYSANRSNATITKADIRGTSTTLTSTADVTNVAVDSRGYVYAASIPGNSVSRFPPGATTPDQTFTSAGGVNFNAPFGMAFDSSDNLYLFDRDNHRVVKITPAGATSVFGSTGTTGDRLGIAVDADGNVYTASGTTVSGTNPGEVRKLLPDGTPAGGNWPVSIADPQDVAIGPDGNVYVSRGRTGVAGDIFRITPAGIATDVGKTGNWPLGISFDAAGNIYVADRDSSTITKVTTMTCSDISEATGSSYTLQAGDAGKQLRVRVTAVNGVSPDAVAYSAITTGPKNTAVPEISGTTAVGQTLTTSKGSWSAAPAIPGPAGYSYQWQRCESAAVAGDTWVSQTTVANRWYGMEWGGPPGDQKFVAVAGDGTNAEPTKRVMTSPDGVAWTLRNTPDAALNSVVWGGLTGQKKFVAVGPNNVMTSPDGETWTAIPSPSSVVTSYVWRSVTWGGPAGSELFVAVGLSGAVMTSPDGVTWEQRTAPVLKEWFAVTWGDPPGATPGQFVAVADRGSGDQVMTSPDGINWTSRTTNANDWAAVTFGGPLGEEKFVAVAYSGVGNRVMTSPDGITWTTRSTPVASNFDAVVWGGIPGQERFVAVADFTSSGTSTGMVMTSPDGVTWTARDAPSYNQWHAVEWGGPAGRERFVAVAYDGGTNNRAMTSSGPDCADISGATNQTYAAQPADYLKYVRSRVTADNGVDPDGVAYSSISSQIAGQAPTNSGGANAPTITGTAKVGETLTADKGTWTATPAIPDPAGYSYQWQRCTGAGSGCSNIPSATSSTYTAQADDYDTYLRVEVTADNGVDPDGTAFSDSSSQVAGIPPTNAGGANAPTISGTAEVGETLTATSPGTWSGTPSTFTYAYQWQVSANGTGDWSSATGTGATTPGYTIAPADYNKYLRVQVTANNGASPNGVAFSDSSSQVAGIPPTNAGGADAPTITGTAKVREILTAAPGTWSGSPAPTFSYQWQRCDTDSGSCTDITAAESATYVLQPADTGKYMRVKVTASNGVSPNADAYSQAPYPGPVEATASRTLYVNKYSPNRSSTPGCATPDFTEIGSADPSFGAVGAAVSGDTIHICGSPDAATDTLTATTGPYTPNVTLSTKSLTFVGDGPALTILDGEDNRTLFYADRHDAGQATSHLDFEAMTITRGRDINSGGGVQAVCRDVRVTNAHFTDNQDLGFGDGGGAIHTWDGGCSGLADVTVVDSVFSGNIAARLADYGQSGSDGGAILAYGTVTVTDSVFEDNEARATTDSTDPPRGGAIYARDGVSVTDSEFTSNSAVGPTAATRPGGIGGAIHAGGGISVTDSTFTSNSAIGPTAVTSVGANGGAIYAALGPPMTISGSTFVDNAVISANGFAGAVRRFGGDLSVTNSTFTGNEAGDAPVISSSDTITFMNVTLSDNDGPRDVSAGGDLTIGNSIINETGETCVTPGARVNLGGNVIADTTASTGDCTPFVGTGGGPATRVAPADIALQPLADNGGPTKTMALGLTSVARTSAGANLLGSDPEDQRGLARPASNQSSGAYQLTTLELAVEKTGGGSGTVTSSPAGIDCGPSCPDQSTPVAQNPPFTTVTLTATAAPGSEFVGWSRAECTGTGPCEVPMDVAREVTATFVLIHRLSVTTSGTGSGVVTSTPAGIDCGNVCAEDYRDGEVVTLTAAAATGSTFSGWNGACSATGPCSVTMDQARSVTATFAANAQPAPTPDPNPNPNPGPDPTPRAEVKVTSTLAVADRQIRLLVRVNEPGMVRVVGSYTTGAMRSQVRACSTRRTVPRAGNYPLACRLLPRTRALLRTRSLRINLRVTLSTSDGQATTSHTMRIKRHKPDVPPVTG